MGAVSRFEEIAQKNVSLVQFFQPFADCGGSSCSFYGFPTEPLEAIRDHGSIPVLSWSSQSIPSSLEEPDFQLSDVVEGRYDSYIAEFAQEAKEWGHPFFLRFNWEMNGNWFPWSEGVNGNRGGEYVAAWRHVHDVFAAAGATNVTWVWCPYVDPGGSLVDISHSVPGRRLRRLDQPRRLQLGDEPRLAEGLEELRPALPSTYEKITKSIAPSKPMMIGEVGSSELGGSKAAWTQDMLEKVPTEYPQMRALLWFDKFDDGMDWPIETSASAGTAFAKGIQDPIYVGNAYGGLAPGTIQPPS